MKALFFSALMFIGTHAGANTATPVQLQCGNWVYQGQINGTGYAYGSYGNRVPRLYRASVRPLAKGALILFVLVDSDPNGTAVVCSN